eukprot:Skav203034  [mRNA]  locus=scaffold583:532609:534506:+ [translate_table: standard]
MSAIAGLARAEAAENPRATAAIHDLARVRLEDAEFAGQKVLEKHGCAVPIPIDHATLGPEKRVRQFPHIKFSNWIKFLLKTGRLPMLMTGSRDLQSMRVKLKEFWRRYREIYPSHGIFSLERSGVDLSLVIPCMAHADEGRSYKKQAIWILSTHSALGRGTRAWLEAGGGNVPLHRNGFGLNYVGSTWASHCMFACMLRKFHKKDPQVLDNLLALYADDMEALLKTGVRGMDGTPVRCCLIACKGDLPALARVGNMLHTFSNTPRAASTRTPCKGIFWMCKAGQEADVRRGLHHIPFEDSSGQPRWEQSLGQQQPWRHPPPILRASPLSEAEQWRFFQTDVWHNLHLGVGKHWCGSSFVTFVETLEFADGVNSMDDKMQALNVEYKAWCSAKHLTPHVEELSRETIAWPIASSCPCGSWHKGAATTHFMQFLEDYCEKRDLKNAADPLLQAIAPWLHKRAVGTSVMNAVMASFFREGFFIRAFKAEKLAKLWLLFLQKYSRAAELTYQRGLARFALTPKHHMLHHGCIQLLRQAQHARQNGTGWAVNPLATSVQMQEDFVGRPSRLSRRVNAKRIHTRVCQRSLIAAMEALKQSDQDKRGLFFNQCPQ